MALWLSAALFLFCMNPGTDWFDSPELAQSAFFIDPTHPPGQPLFVMFGKLMTFMPLAGVMTRTTLLGLIAAAFCVALLFILPPLGDRKTASARPLRGPTLMFIAALALHTPLLLQAGRTEVYTLHALLAVALLLVGQLALAENSERPAVWGILAAWIFGLGVANHHFLMLLMLPYLLAVAWRLPLPARASRARLCLWGVCFAGCGASLYLLLPLRAAADTPLNWGRLGDWQGFVDFFRGRDFNVYFLWPWRDHRPFVAALRVVGVLWWVVSLAALPWMWRRQRARLWLLLAAASAMLAATVKIFYVENPDAYGYVLPAFLALALLVVPLLRGLPSRAAWTSSALLLLLSLLAFWFSPQPLWRARERLAQAYVYDLELYAPYASMVLVRSDHAFFPPLLAQNIERSRPDLAIIAAGMWGASWYRDALARRYTDLHVDHRIGAAAPILSELNPTRPLLAEYAQTFDGAAAGVVPWRLWYRAAGTQSQETATDVDLQQTLLVQEYGRTPRDYRMSGAQIVDQHFWQRAIFEYQRGNLPLAVRAMERAAGEPQRPVDFPSDWRPTTTPLLWPLIPSPYPAFITRPADLLVELGRFYLQTSGAAGRQAAQAVFQRAAELGNANGLLLLADADFRGARPAQALQWLQRLPATEPRRDLALGIYYYWQGELPAAQNNLERAARLLPQEPGAAIYLARIAVKRGDTQTARRRLEQALQRQPHDPQLHAEWRRLGGSH